MLFLFVALPLFFKRYKQAIAINLGIIAAILLFFSQTYYLAIPLILVSVVLFKKSSILTVIYYALISVPMTMMQYLQYILQIPQVEWWLEPGSSPPIYISLSAIFKELQQSLLQFRLYDTSKFVYALVDQVTAPSNTDRINLSTVLNQYMDSIPGIVLFLAIVVGAIFVVALVARFLVKSGLPEMERFLPIFLAGSATAIFFLFLSALQKPLAFRADINAVQIVIGMVAAVLFTLPTAFVEYSPKKSATADMILEKARELMAKLQNLEVLLDKAKTTLPVAAAVGLTETKLLVIKDKLKDTLSTALERFTTSELDKKFSELDPELSNELDALISELNVTLSEYHMYINCEYSTWLGKFGDIGLEVKATVPTDFQKDLPIDVRIDRAKEVLDAGRALANSVIQTSEQIYETIRSLYAENLPDKSQTVAFAKQQLDEAAPWSAMDALFTALNNWRKQYGTQIAQSVEALQTSLTPIANLGTQRDSLLPVLGGDVAKLLDYAKRAEDVKLRIGKPAGIMSVIVVRGLLQSSLDIARGVLSILYAEIESTETAIESLLPTKNYLWERNVTLRKRMATALEIICDSEKYAPRQVLENLPKALFDIDECVETIIKYADKKELLLNYPIAAMAIEDLFKQKKKITADDLPFESKYAAEYLRLFYGQRYSEFSFDDSSLLLTRRA